MPATTVIGSTGLVGHEILLQLLSHPSATAVSTLIRRDPPQPSLAPKHHQTIEPDSTKWPSTLSTLLPTPKSTLFSALGTTRSAAGGVDAQRKIDLDLNLELAKSAKESGKVSTYVLISSANADAGSKWNAYVQMKGELEEEVKKLGFEKTVIVRPGLILGEREKKRLGEEQVQWVAKGLRKWVPSGWVDSWAQDAGVIARAAVRAGLEEEVWEGRKLERTEGGKVWVMGQDEIVELGTAK
ncbi:hypothetical protein EX30DRAFT_343427 [Ascodesmis nigricans]|uniref:NAD(P)-binding domain-containing protein n=1 Tax=Ascodesmis nigricans TaxID=341454 RepID=A0A4S2MM91_9PEZI|nr:hypothetical protein EX30DRAFT_343427 [Ascodesmis nigricans]